MKGKFYAPTATMQLDEALKQHQPYAVLTVSTTGLDNASFDKHMPTRVCATQFEYDENIKQYRKEVTFDRLVDCGKDALNKAIENQHDYDVFENGGINLDDYAAGKGVLSQAEFKKEFDLIMEAMNQDKTTLILNGGLRHCETFLDRIDCANGLRKINEAGRILDQTRLTQEYFQQHEIESKATLEELRNSMIPSPKLSFYNDKEKMRDFKKLSKEDFLKSYPYLREREYDITAKDMANKESKIIGGDKRIDVINRFVTKHGREAGIFESEWKSYQREADAAYMDSLSESGKEKYKNEDIANKLNILINKKTLIPEKITQGESEYHKLIKALSGEEGNKGIIILHTATTGFERGSIPQNTGFPIQFTAVAYPCYNGVIDLDVKNNAASFNIKAPQRSLVKAEEKIKNGEFDAFKYAGIDKNGYMSGKGVFSSEKAIERLNKYFEKFPLKDYKLITLGGMKGTDRSFAQTSMLNMGSFEFCSVDSIDFSQAIKDYTFLVNTDSRYPKNVLFNEADMKDKTFSLEDISAANGVDDVNGTVKRCYQALSFINKMETQHLELFKPEIFKESENILNEHRNSTVKAKTPVKSNLQPSAAAIENVFIEDGYDNVEKIPDLSPADMQKIESEARNRFFEEEIEPVISESQHSHGRLYSDKKNDTADVVIASGVHKIGETAIPHISEAAQKTRDTVSERMPERPRDLSDRSREIQDARDRRGGAYRREQPNGLEGVDIRRLIDIISAQSETIMKQGEIINQQNEKLLNILQEQNDIMRQIALNKDFFQERPINEKTEGEEEKLLTKGVYRGI